MQRNDDASGGDEVSVRKFHIDWYLAILISVLVVCCGAYGWGVHNHQDDMSDWYENEHTCPECGWTGHVGLMVKHGNFLLTKYYCPVCGKLLGAY